MSNKSNFATIEKVSWDSVKKRVILANPEFSKVIDNNVAAGKNFPLYLARYPFGSVILKTGSIYLPAPDGTTVPFDSPKLPSELIKDLGYREGRVPLSMILEHSAELFMEPKGGVVPFSLMRKGKIFALWGLLNPSMEYIAPKVWHISSGARTLFMLPKITDATSYRKLARARGLKLTLPRTLLDQGPVLTQMSQSKDFATPWQTEILFFSAGWIKERPDENWIRFHHFLLQQAWNNTDYWRNKVVYDFVWDSFVKELAREGIKVNAHIVDIVKHLITLGLGILPGFSPALDNEIAPIDGLQADFIEHYGLKQFAPTIFVPHHFTISNPKPVYWSLQLPAYFESSPKPRTEISVLNDLRDVHALLDRFLQAVLKGSLEGVIDTPVYDFAKSIQYDFFHSEADIGGSVRLSKDMPAEDKTLILNKYGQKGFSHISPFVRGCVRVSVKK